MLLDTIDQAIATSDVMDQVSISSSIANLENLNSWTLVNNPWILPCEASLFQQSLFFIFDGSCFLWQWSLLVLKI